jgi:tRNA (adenine58-N1)-methyltransferase non-catalytic subunit
MDFLSAFHPDSIVLTPPKEGGNLYERKLRTYNRELEVHKKWKEAGFDGLICVSSFDPQSYLPQCLERLELCASIAIYSPFREPIVDLQNFCQTKLPTRPILAPSVHEIRAPKWNTLKGRVRPNMQGRGGGGWVFSGTRVEESEPETRDWREGKKKKRKVEGTSGTEMEDVKTDSAIETD